MTQTPSKTKRRTDQYGNKTNEKNFVHIFKRIKFFNYNKLFNNCTKNNNEFFIIFRNLIILSANIFININKNKVNMSNQFQYQPINFQNKTTKSPNFLTSKLLDKSAPNLIVNKPYSYNLNANNKQSQGTQNPNKTAYLSSKLENISQTQQPKSFLQNKTTYNNYASNPGLKFYNSPIGLKTQEKTQRNQRPSRGQMARSLIIEENQNHQQSTYNQAQTKYVTPLKINTPPRRAPRMSQPYIPHDQQKQFDPLLTSTNSTTDSQSPFLNKEINFMKIKTQSFQQQKEKKPINIPSFLSKNSNSSTNDMKRSNLDIYNDMNNLNLDRDSSPNLQPTNSLNNSTNMTKSKRKVKASDFQKIKQLGNGKYGRVYLVRQKSCGFICALKVIQKKLLVQEQITEQFIRQLKIQMFLNHPNIIKMYGYFDDDKNIYIILQVGTGGQLYHHLKKSQSLPEQKVAFLMKQICQAVNQIHSLRIIHRDIKPQNIVLHDNIIKLCDFGWSVHQDNKLRTTFCGTPLYVCPQILRGKQYDQKIDIWSLGIMMYEMVVGQNPFKITKQEELIKIVKDQIKIPSYVYVSAQARDFLDKCLQKNPSDRVTIRQLINHPFFKKYQDKNEKKAFNL